MKAPSQDPAKDLLLTVTFPTRLERGQHTEVTLKLSNRSPSTITLTYPTSKTFDFQVFDADGNVVYVWSRSKFFLETLTRVSISPRSSQASTLGWRVELLPGRYVLVGMSDPMDSRTLTKIHLESSKVVFEVRE